MGEIFIETKRFGKILKVTVIDAESGVEVSFQAPITTAKSALQRLAMNKMRYVLARQHK